MFHILGTLKIIKKIEFLTRMLRPLCARWAYGSWTDAHPERARQKWSTLWAYASVPDVHAQHAHQFSYFSNVHFVYPQHARKELMCALSMRIRNWACWAWASGTDAYAEPHESGMGMGMGMPGRSSVISGELQAEGEQHMFILDWSALLAPPGRKPWTDCLHFYHS